MSTGKIQVGVDDLEAPLERADGSRQTCDGMSLRDYFAAKAMQAMIAKSPPILCSSMDDDPGPEFFGYHAVALGAYRYADAMIKQRGR
ncbi:MAG: hypothetical protein OEW90_01025 [Betaproteobacteria bacterium]|nr:hypothetical protein [Betaproteobacteria bacterium]